MLETLKGGGDLTELECIAIVDGGIVVRRQAFAIDTRSIRAIEIGQCVRVASVFQQSVDTGNGIGTLEVAEIDSGPVAAEIVIVASNDRLALRQLDVLTAAERQATPGGACGGSGRGLRGRLSRLRRLCRRG